MGHNSTSPRILADEEDMLPSVRNLGLVAAILLCPAVSASAQTLSLISGDGQIVLENFRSTAPFVVRATDAQGRSEERRVGKEGRSRWAPCH